MTYFAPPVTPEQLYHQDKRRREWEEKERKTRTFLERTYASGYLVRPEWMNGKIPDKTILGDREQR